MGNHDTEMDNAQLEGEESSENVLDDPEESAHLESIFNSFHAYRRTAHYSITHVRRQSFYAMPSAHWNLLASAPFSILDHLDRVDDAIDSNADIAEACLATSLPSFGYEPLDRTASIQPDWTRKPVNSSDQGKCYQTIRQLFRDWSAEGQPERDACYMPVLSALDQEFIKLPLAQRGNVRVLVPGAGLGRLLFEVVCKGYSAEGNELSYHQVIVSNHILNHVQRAQQYTLYPWALGFSNHLSRTDQLLSVKVPDCHPGFELLASSQQFDMPVSERMSMCSGDFVEIYSRPSYNNAFDAITTVFFIDTAPNFLTYIATIQNCLKASGVWINLGPLLWHFENHDAQKSRGNSDAEEVNTSSGSRGSIMSSGAVELTNEEVHALLEHHGFRVEQSKSDMIETGYIQNPRSMLQSTYRPVFWVARKL